MVLMKGTRAKKEILCHKKENWKRHSCWRLGLVGLVAYRWCWWRGRGQRGTWCTVGRGSPAWAGPSTAFAGTRWGSPLPSQPGPVQPRHGPNIYKDTKPYMSAFLKSWPVKVLGGRCLSVWGPGPLPLPPPPSYTLYEYMCPCTYSHREWGRVRGVSRTSEKISGALPSSQEGSKITTRLTVSPVYKFY